MTRTKEHEIAEYLQKLSEATDEKVLLLRTCNANMTSNGGFKWPENGYVEAPDWDGGKPVCGGKLHGFLWGEGNGLLASWMPDAKWLIFEALASEVIYITENNGGKHGARRGNVVYCGDRKSTTDYLLTHDTFGHAVIGATLTGGDGAILTGGHGAILTGGNESTLTGGNESTLTGGYWSTLIGGKESTLTGGDGSTLTGGDGATLTGGYKATLTGGYGSTLTGGNESTLTGGDGATLTGGDGATLTGGDGATLTGGDGAIIQLSWRNGFRKRIVTGYIGEKGLLPYVAYKLNADGTFVVVQPSLEMKP